MAIIEDAYQFGLDHAIGKTSGFGIKSKLENLSGARDISMALVPEFFSEYREYPYTKSNAELVFQTIYYAVLDKLTDLLKNNIKMDFSKFRAEIFASKMFGEFTGERQAVRQSVNIGNTPLERLVNNFTISTGHKPDLYALEELKRIIDIGDRIARKHGATKANIDWSSLNLYLQPGMTQISAEHINEIREALEELFTEPSIREELKDAKAIYNDHRYNIILAWFGGSQIHAYYNGKEINVVSVGGVPRDKIQAEIVMSEITKEPEYPEYLATDQEQYKEFLKMSGHSVS